MTRSTYRQEAMARPTTVAAKYAHLVAHADRVAQVAYALELLSAERSTRLLEAALAALERAPVEALVPAARPVLRALYDRLDANGPRTDAGGALRAAIVRLLQRLACPADTDILARAAMTFEFQPPGPEEVAAMLRASGLAALHAIDEALAASYAVRLLGDTYTSPMSGEPALTAARVLAAQNRWLPLYAYTVDAGRRHSEVLSECLRALVRLPAPLLADLVDRYADGNDELALVGLFDLILEHPDGEAHAGRLATFLRDTQLYGAYRYLCTLIVARRHVTLLPALIALADEEHDPLKWEPLAEALSLLSGSCRVDAALRCLRTRIECAQQ